MSVKIEIGEEVRRLRKRRNMTQQELAEACEMGVSTIIRMERGYSAPYQKTIRKVAQGLGVDPQELTRFW